MLNWSDKFNLGKSAFVKRELRRLPQTELEFEADFFFDRESSRKDQEKWIGMVIAREFGDLLAMKEVTLPPPTVNDLAGVLAHAMSRPLTGGNRQRPSTIHLRDRPQWHELLPHLRQLGIRVLQANDLPWFDNAAVEWMRQTKRKRVPSIDEMPLILREPFPERKRSLLTDARDLMEWTDAMSKLAYPSRMIAVLHDDAITVVPIELTTDELELIVTKTEIARTKKLRPRLEAMGAEGRAIELDFHEWSRVLLALCGQGSKEAAVRKRLLRIAKRIANRLAKVLKIDPPTMRK